MSTIYASDNFFTLRVPLMLLYQPMAVTEMGIGSLNPKIEQCSGDETHEQTSNESYSVNQEINVNTRYEGKMQAVTPVKLKGIFVNAGRIASCSVFKTGLSQNGMLNKTIPWETIVVPLGGQSEHFPSRKIAESDKNLITYWTLYNGHRKEMIHLLLPESADGHQAQLQGPSLLTIVRTVESLMLAVFARRERRKKTCLSADNAEELGEVDQV